MIPNSPIKSQIPISSALTKIRMEWQEAACGDSLLCIEGNVGLILMDLINVLEIPVDEQVTILGTELFDEMQSLINISTQQ